MKPDKDNIFKHEAKEAALFKRYGKRASINIAFSHNGDTFKTMDDLSVLELTFTSPRGAQYRIVEHFKGGNTDFVLFEYTHGNRQIRNKFCRFLDAEVKLVDCLAEEED